MEKQFPSEPLIKEIKQVFPAKVTHDVSSFHSDTVAEFLEKVEKSNERIVVDISKIPAASNERVKFLEAKEQFPNKIQVIESTPEEMALQNAVLRKIVRESTGHPQLMTNFLMNLPEEDFLKELEFTVRKGNTDNEKIHYKNNLGLAFSPDLSSEVSQDIVETRNLLHKMYLIVMAKGTEVYKKHERMMPKFNTVYEKRVPSELGMDPKEFSDEDKRYASWLAHNSNMDRGGVVYNYTNPDKIQLYHPRIVAVDTLKKYNAGREK